MHPTAVAADLFVSVVAAVQEPDPFDAWALVLVQSVLSLATEVESIATVVGRSSQC